LRLLLQFF